MILCGLDGSALALLRAAEQDDGRLAVLSEVDTVAGSEVELDLEHACPASLNVRPVACAEASQGRGHAGGRHGVQSVKPLLERALSSCVNELPYFKGW